MNLQLLLVLLICVIGVAAYENETKAPPTITCYVSVFAWFVGWHLRLRVLFLVAPTL